MLLDYDRLGLLKWPLVAICVVVSLFLLLPIVFIAALSFGDSQWLQFPPPGWTLRWYEELFHDSGWVEAFFASAKIATIVTILSVTLGLMASLALHKGKFPGKKMLQALFLTPMVLPVVVLAVALYALFLKFNLTGSMLGYVIGHLIIALPFSIITISNSLETFEFALEDAAMICGATPLQVKLKVTIPAIKLGIFAAAIFSFLISWDEVVLSIFMATPGMQTLPVRIWGAMRQDLSPVIAAASTLLIGFTIILMLLAKMVRKGK